MQFPNKSMANESVFDGIKCMDCTIPEKDFSLPSSSHTNFTHPVYMSEDDVNRLIKSGHIRFIQGKLHYEQPPNQKPS